MAQTVRPMDTHMVSEESNKVLLAHKDPFKHLISTCYWVLRAMCRNGLSETEREYCEITAVYVIIAGLESAT